MNKKYISGAVALAAIATLVLAVPALADTSAAASAGVNTAVHASLGKAWGAMMGGARTGMMKNGVFGTVTAVSGNTITISAKQFVKPATGTTPTPGTPPAFTTVTYTIDATNAKVTKANVASTVSAIAVGDTIVAQGTVTGTSVSATTIRDGIMMGGAGMGRGEMGEGTSTPKTPPTPVITGNGEPIIAGKVTAISGATLTVTNASNVTYSVDVTNAKVAQGNTLVALTSVQVGDSVVVQGTVNANAVVAYSVTDTKAPTTGGAKPAMGGFLGTIKNFFSHLFGF